MSLAGWILLALLGLTLFCFAMFEIGRKQHKEHPAQGSNYASPRSEESNQQDAHNRAGKKERDGDSVFESAEKHSEILLVIVTTLLVLITGFLWLATRDLVKGSERIGGQQIEEMKKSADATIKAANAAESSVKEAREAARLDQRAWIVCTQVLGVAEENKSLSVEMVLKNVGKTPAKNLKIVAGWQWSAVQAGLDFSDVDNETDPTGSAAVIAPGAEYSAWTPVMNQKPFTSDDIGQIRSQGMTLFVYGKITYDDVLGCSHWSTFCYRLAPNCKTFVIDQRHNDVDDNRCP